MGAHAERRYLAQAMTVAIAGLAVAACGTPTAARQDAARSTATASAIGTPVPTPTPTPTPTADPRPTAEPGGAIVEAAILQRVNNMSIPPDCPALADSRFTATCGSVALDGGDAVWLVEHQPDPAADDGGQLWTARVYIHHKWYGEASWGIFYSTGLSPVHAANIAAASMPLSSGASLLLIGLRTTDGLLRYDAIAGVPGDFPALAGGNSAMVHGSVVIAGDQLTDYAGVCPDQAPATCTPTQYTVRTLALSTSDHTLHVASTAVASGPPPAGVLR